METLPFLCATITIGCASRAPQAPVRGGCDTLKSAHATKANLRLRPRARYSPLPRPAPRLALEEPLLLGAVTPALRVRSAGLSLHNDAGQNG